MARRAVTEREIDIVRNYVGVKVGKRRIKGFDTLLARFLRDRFFSYGESRALKKNPVGPSTGKYLCSLLVALLNLPLKAIARGLGMKNYGVLKNWNMDEEFQALVNEHREAFIKVWLEHSWEKVVLLKAEREKFLKKPLAEIERNPLPIPDYSEFGDLKYYHPKLFEKIVNWGESLKSTKALKAKDYEVYKELGKILTYGANITGIPLFKEWSTFLENGEILLDHIRELLLKSRLTERERKEGIYESRIVKGMLGITREYIERKENPPGPIAFKN